jgi:hypothetical protein
LSDHADVRGNGEEAIDDMDHTTVECNVLQSIVSFFVKYKICSINHLQLQ